MGAVTPENPISGTLEAGNEIQDAPLVPPGGPQPNEYGTPTPGQSFLDRFREGPAIIPPGGPQPNQYGEPMLLSPLTGPGKKYPSVQVGGVFAVDSVWFSQDKQNIKSVGDELDGTAIKRAMLTMFGSVSDNVDYRFQFDLGRAGRPSIFDMYLDLKLEEVIQGRLRIGHFRQPFSLEELTSFRFNPFIDRSSLYLFNPSRRMGVGLFDWDEDLTSTWFVSVFRANSDLYGDDLADRGGVGGSGRITKCFWYEKEGTEVLHGGLSYAIVSPTNNILNIGRNGGNAPELFVSQGQFATAGFQQTQSMLWVMNLPADYFQYFHAEAALVHGPLSVQTEADLMRVTTSRDPGMYKKRTIANLGTAPIFGGCYIFATWFLTGEHRTYDRNLAVFDRIMPKSRADKGNLLGGAWELGVRFNYLTLNSEQVTGGKIMDPTFAVNWYLNPYTKFSFNYIPVWLQAPNGAQIVNDRNTKQQQYNSQASAWGIQAQVDF